MLFALICKDRPGADMTALRAKTRPAHLAYLEPYRAQILLGGPLRDASDSQSIGSLLVVDFASREEVERFCAQDPYVQAGLFATLEIHPFTKVFLGQDDSHLEERSFPR